MCHDVADHLIHVSALREQIGVGVVFRDAPHAVALVPECGPPRVLLQDGGQPRGVLGPGQAGHRVTGSPAGGRFPSGLRSAVVRKAAIEFDLVRSDALARNASRDLILKVAEERWNT